MEWLVSIYFLEIISNSNLLALYECAKRSELIQLKTIAWCPNQLLVWIFLRISTVVFYLKINNHFQFYCFDKNSFPKLKLFSKL